MLSGSCTRLRAQIAFLDDEVCRAERQLEGMKKLWNQLRPVMDKASDCNAMLPGSAKETERPADRAEEQIVLIEETLAFAREIRLLLERL